MYVVGIILALLAGVSTFLGQLLQKKVINTRQANGLVLNMKVLIKTPLWFIGFLLSSIINAIIIMIAQGQIGPALTPGLLASGLIVLAIGSWIMLGEKLRLTDWAAILLIVGSIILISLSELSIAADESRFWNNSFVIKLVVYSIIILGLAYLSFFGGRRLKSKAALPMAISSGLCFGLATLWQALFVVAVQTIGAANVSTIVFFIVSLILFVSITVLGIISSNKTFEIGDASIVVPFQQLPQQIMPILTFFVIFALPAPSNNSYYFMFSGVLILIIAMFLLSKKREVVVSKESITDTSTTLQTPTDDKSTV